MNDYISVDTPDGSFSAYIARARTFPAPVVVVVQEIFGLSKKTSHRPISKYRSVPWCNRFSVPRLL